MPGAKVFKLGGAHDSVWHDLKLAQEGLPRGRPVLADTASRLLAAAHGSRERRCSLRLRCASPGLAGLRCKR